MAPRLLSAGGGLRRVLDVLGDDHTVVWEAEMEPGLFTSVTKTVEGLLGYSPREWVDDPLSWLARVHPDDRDRVSEAWTRAAEGDRLDIEYRFAKKDGSEVTLWHIGQLVPATVRPMTKLRGLIVDVTERRRLEVGGGGGTVPRARGAGAGDHLPRRDRWPPEDARDQRSDRDDPRQSPGRVVRRSQPLEQDRPP